MKRLIFLLLLCLPVPAFGQIWNGQQFSCTMNSTLSAITMLQSSPVVAVAGAWTASSGLGTVITSSTNTLPLFSLGDYFEVRDHSTAGNNGRYVVTGTSTVASLTAAKVVTPNPANAGEEATSFYRQSKCDQITDGRRRYITDIQWASETIGTAVNFLQLSYGTGLDCATTSTPIFTDFNPTTFSGRSFSLQVPIITPINTEICFIHPGGGVLVITVGGYAR